VQDWLAPVGGVPLHMELGATDPELSRHVAVQVRVPLLAVA
jgi:hypothetical protein